jgi:hypothetical protein
MLLDHLHVEKAVSCMRRELVINSRGLGFMRNRVKIWFGGVHVVKTQLGISLFSFVDSFVSRWD